MNNKAKKHQRNLLEGLAWLVSKKQTSGCAAAEWWWVVGRGWWALGTVEAIQNKAVIAVRGCVWLPKNTLHNGWQQKIIIIQAGEETKTCRRMDGGDLQVTEGIMDDPVGFFVYFVVVGMNGWKQSCTLCFKGEVCLFADRARGSVLRPKCPKRSRCSPIFTSVL